ncbi:FxSxx-COOH system tetratricopeptide repeat protein [Actinomadura fibrosa]|uniref:FxSxx-COOH system tetratricopeptide repeat protein n=1 Tax=Actinomadura fibrosa TaxID=111802 RepID=A0ABW2XEC4_9ACTN|nr:FxSxx-COOH system tetratricopeptide repeat protein [Actinomadura fibrosa]
MGSIRRRPTPPGPITDLFDRLNELHLEAGLPSVRQTVAGIGRGVISTSSVYNTLAGPRVPAWHFLALVVEELGGSVDDYRPLWSAARRAELEGGQSAEASPVGESRSRTEVPEPSRIRLSDTTRSLWGSSIPSRNPHFTARFAELQALEAGYGQQATADREGPVVQALYGQGGVGKTEIAVEYAHRHRRDYELVWWIRAEQEDLIRDALTDLADHLELHDTRGGDSDQLIRSTLKALQWGVPYQTSLLIFDNAIRPEVILRYLPEDGAHVLITTQSQGWRRALPAATLDIREFEIEEATEFLENRLTTLRPFRLPEDGSGRAAEPDPVEEAAYRESIFELAKVLDGLPLAAEHAAAYLNETEATVEDYLHAFRRTAREIVHPDADFLYPHAVATSYAITQEALTPEAVTLLRVVAMISPEPLSEELLVQPLAREELPPEARSVLTDTKRFRLAVRELARFSLLRYDALQSELQLHRIVKAVVEMSIRQDGPEEERRKRRIAHVLLAASDRLAPEKEENDRAYQISRPHLIPSGAVDSDHAPTRDLVINQVRWLQVRARFSEAYRLAEYGFGRWRRNLGEDHLQTLALATELGHVLRQLGRLREASNLDMDVKERLRSRYGEENEVFLNCARNHGIDLRVFGRYKEALEQDEHLLPLYMRVFGEDHFQTLNMLNNIAIGLRCIGHYEKALEYDLRTHAARVYVLGEMHLRTLDSQFAVARDLRRLGRYEESLDELIKINRIVERRDEPWLQPTLLFSLDLGVALRRVGHHREALDHLETVYARHQAVMGADHRQTLTVAANLVNDRRLAGRLRSARTLAESIIRRMSEVIGEEHPNTFAAKANMAPVLRYAGDLEEAHRIDAEALDGLVRIFGQEHPYCLVVMCNHASDLAAAGAADEAVRMGERAFSLSRQVRGEDHPFTLATAANLALDLWRAGSGDRASALHDETLERYRAVLSQHHPETRAVGRKERVDLDIEPDVN